MSAPPLSQIGRISDAASFYNPPEEIQRPAEISGAEGSSTSQTNSEESRQPVSRATMDPSLQASYIGENGRLTQLRALDTMLEKMDGSSTTSLSEETVMQLLSMSRTLIQFVVDQQANNGQLQMTNTQLKTDQQTMQVREQEMKVRVRLLKAENKWLRETKEGLRGKVEDLKLAARAKRSYASMEAQEEAHQEEAHQEEAHQELDYLHRNNKRVPVDLVRQFVPFGEPELPMSGQETPSRSRLQPIWKAQGGKRKQENESEEEGEVSKRVKV